MNFFDRAISFFSPKLGLIRQRYRSYESAAYSRRTKSFDKASSTGPNIEVGNALSTLRNRSRFFVRNNGWAKRAIQSVTNNTIGEGIRPAPNGTKNQIKKAKQLWKTWAESTTCDWYGKNTFYGLQALIMKEIAEGGDVLIIRRRVKPTIDNLIPIKIQVLEGDYLDHSKDHQSYDDGGYSRLGVKFDKSGQLLGYWVFDNHPSDGMIFFNNNKLDSTFISKDDCLHVFEVLRVGQVRGVPMGIASFIKLSDFGDYEDAQLLRQKVAACFSAFISGDESVTTDILEHVEPGIIQYLKPGETVTFGNPPPAEGYDSYSKKILQGIAASYGITYEMLTMDYSNVNFSSGRMAKIDITPVFRGWQYNMLVPQCCVPVWNWFIDAAIMAGLTQTKVLCSCTDWTAPRVQQLDPTKETAARVLQIQSGLTTISECLREDGRDPEEFFDEYKADMDRLKLLGINVSSIIIPQVQPDNSNNNNQQNDTQNQGN